ncbi:MAG: hypothetical protein ACP5IO_03285 [Elusimicrobiales bacterium]
MKKCPICSSQKVKKGGFIEVCKSVVFMYLIFIILPIIIIRTKNASFHRFAYKYLNFFSFLIKSPGVFVSCGFTYKSIVILLSKYDFEIEDVYLDLTKGDPYKQFSFSSFLGFIKKVYYFISLLFFKLSLKHILISPSFMVFAVRKR